MDERVKVMVPTYPVCSSLIALTVIIHCSASRLIDTSLATINMSSTLTYNNINFNKENAVDGNPSRSPNDCHCCSATSAGEMGWWMIDLGAVHLLERVVVYGRNDSNFGQGKPFNIMLTSSTSMDNMVTQIHSGDPNIDDNTYNITLDPPRKARILKIERTLPGVMTICEVEMYGSGLNIIDNDTMLTEQSRNFSTCIAERAIDGVSTYIGDDDADLCAVCSVALDKPGTNQNWWQIDLLTPQLVDTIKVVGRKGTHDQSDHLRLHINNDTMKGDNYAFNVGLISTMNWITPCTYEQSDDLRLHINNDTMKGDNYAFNVGLISTMNRTTLTAIVKLTPMRLFRYFEINNDPQRKHPLALCEVELYGGVCPRFSYGDNCSLACHCADHKPCDGVSGKCHTSGCLPGWFYDSCDTECVFPTFGQGCNSTCHCYNNSSCNHSSGICATGVCAPGWKSESCDMECDFPTFGQNCSSTCHCLNDGNCNHTSGYCENGICAPGWQNKSCDAECIFPSFGQNCSSTCHCIKNGQCDHTTGECESGLCAPGWKGSSCDTVCEIPNFGQNCSSVCHCLNNSYCDSEDGYCHIEICAPGWRNESCDVECAFPSFGQNCSSRCHCSDGGECNHVTGECNNGLCAPGWKGDSCDSKCEIPNFGQNCSSVCHCLNNSNCDSEYGKCDIGICAPGWKGNSCDAECECPSFGQNCSSESHCSNSSQCNHITGHCSSGICYPGWKGISCDLECNSPTFGQNCSKTCHCSDSSPCDHETGHCFSGVCAPGWSGDSCYTECIFPNFGQNCSTVCHCLDNGTCNHASGHCEIGQCAPGWQNVSCDTPCDPPRFGHNCSSKCHCLHNGRCHYITGICESGICAPGWRQSSCDTECTTPEFGQNCSSTCNCYNDGACNPATGICVSGICAPGWMNNSCDTECDDRKFGQNCSSTCHCANASQCNHRNGTCDGIGCEDGWQGHSCSEQRIAQEPPGGPNPSAIAGGTVGGILVIAVALVAVLFYRRFSNNVRKKTPQSKEFDDPKQRQLSTKTQMPIPHETRSSDYYSFEDISGIKVHNIWSYVRDKLDNDSAFFDNDFEKLPSGLHHPSTVAQDASNTGKNRYKEMYAYDHSRVVLKIEDPNETDYINASHIDGYDRVKKFIASQGPTKTMMNDFWRMVWQQKSSKIVMLTRLIEMGQMKCLQYWPDVGGTMSYGNTSVRIISTDDYSDYVVRTLEVTHRNSKPRTIHQYHFMAWPDKDVPDNAWCLVDFLRFVDTRGKPNAAPIVVHCSAGVGRTGTFIALDNLINEANKEGCVRPLQVVEALRGQRINMVQTRNQYVYLHEALAEALLIGTHYLCSRHFDAVYGFMSQTDEQTEKPRIEMQFDLMQQGIADMPVPDAPVYGNLAGVESDAYRPGLRGKGANSSRVPFPCLLPSFNQKEAFLLTTSPTESTLGEFWRLVEQKNVSTIVMLTSPTSEAYEDSSVLGSSSEQDLFTVNLVKSRTENAFHERAFTYGRKASKEPDLSTVKQFSYLGWREDSDTPGDTQSMLDLLDAVQRWQPKLEDRRPILVHCETGFKRCGVFVALLNELRRMKENDDRINLVNTVMMMKQRNKDLITSPKQYKYIYDVLVSYIRQQEVYQNI